MLSNGIKSILASLPLSQQQNLKKLNFRHQIRRGQFDAGEPEFELLAQWLKLGDWALDVGANVGHYTVRLSSLVGPTGRVIAVEPVPRTFELLVSNVAQSSAHNTTLLNVALSDSNGIAGMSVPDFSSGMENLYEARLDQDAAGLHVLLMRGDALGIEQPVRLVKIDVEGHEINVLRGLDTVIARDRPVLIVEGVDPDVEAHLTARGYLRHLLPNSPNALFTMPADVPKARAVA